ncbi:creatininase family protein [Kribbella sp. NPDC051936]|uniref:creatininase family protein n=1 Tax=Kribbella sp. NPDC051936 TaxID=3154946 RepID=UPI00342EFF25
MSSWTCGRHRETSAQCDFHDRVSRVALLPIGAVEQHSRHLPLGTDSLIAETGCPRHRDRAAREGSLAAHGERRRQ